MNDVNILELWRRLNDLLNKSVDKGSLEELPSSPHSRVLTHDVQVSCFFARLGDPHKHRRDRKPGMGISINPGGPSVWNCYTCRRRGGNLVNLLSQVESAFGIPPQDDLRKWIEDHEMITPDAAVQAIAQGIYFTRPDRRREISFDEERIKAFSGRCPKYVLDRGVSLETARLWEVGLDEEQQRATLPVRDVQGSLRGCYGRALHPGQEPKYLRYWDFDPGQTLYGVHLTRRNQPIIVVEGQIDAMKVSQASLVPTVALCGSYMTRMQRQTLVSRASEAWIFSDLDPAGQRLLQYACDQLRPHLPVFVVPYPPECEEGEDPASLSPQEVRECLERRHSPERIVPC